MGEFGDRMKLYEKQETGRQFIPLLPIVARIDGKAFHSFCRGLNKPYDERFVKIMQKVTEYLVEETGAKVGYTQSDEINLAFYSDDIRSQLFFDSKIFKMTSILSSLTTWKFNQLLPEYLPEKFGNLACFDCRVFSLPNLTEAANVFLWREQDATRNSILSAGYSVFSHKFIKGKKTEQVQALLLSEKNINWNDYPVFYKRGTFYQKFKNVRKFTPEEMEKLPEKHEARNNPDLEVERTEIRKIEMPPFGKVTNRVDVLFHGKEPIEDE